MAEIWGAAIAAGISVAGTAYAANQQKNSAEQANAAMGNAQQVQYKNVPFPQLVDYKGAQRDAITQNVSALPNIFNFANQVNRFNVGQAKRGYTQMQPWFERLQQQIGQNAMSFAKGELPADVVASIGRAAASRGLASGFGQGAGGGGVGTALGQLNLRTLGLTSLDLAQKGTQLGMQVNQQAAALTPGLYDISQMFATPSMALAAMGTNAAAINRRNELNAGYQNQGIQENTSLMNAVMQQQAQNSLASGVSQSNQYASGASALGSVLGQALQNYNNQNNSGFYSSSAAAQSALGTNPYGASVTNSPYGYGIRPKMV